jgi:acyl-CoA dehydrogenase
MDFDLPPEAIEIRNTVKKIVDELLQFEPEFHRTGLAPREAQARFKQVGLFGIGVPEEFGGLALDPISSIVAQIELSRLPPQFWPLLRSAIGPSIKTLVNYGTQEQKERYLPKIASGDCGVGIAMTEPQSGSDVSGIRTTAVRDGDHYVLNGVKTFISNANKVDLFTVFAYTNKAGGVRSGISAFLLPADAPGLKVGPPIRTMGWVTEGVFEVQIEDCRVPVRDRLGEEGVGFLYFYRSLNEGRLSVGAQALGAAEIALETTIEYAKQRQSSGHAIAEFQAIQHAIADMTVDVHLSRLMLMDAVHRFKMGQATGKTCSMVKLFCSEAVGRVADRAVQIHGGAGYCRGIVAERVYRDARVLRIYDGTSEIHRNIIAKETLK